MKSMEELRWEIDQLAVEIGYGWHSLTEEDERFVWDLIDFGYKEDLIIQGKCSLAASLKFDSSIWEQKMNKDLLSLKAIFKRLKLF